MNLAIHVQLITYYGKDIFYFGTITYMEITIIVYSMLQREKSNALCLNHRSCKQ